MAQFGILLLCVDFAVQYWFVAIVFGVIQPWVTCNSVHTVSNDCCNAVFETTCLATETSIKKVFASAYHNGTASWKFLNNCSSLIQYVWNGINCWFSSIYEHWRKIRNEKKTMKLASIRIENCKDLKRLVIQPWKTISNWIFFQLL